MRILWRTLPSLALPAALGLGVAYLATGFVPPPAPNLRQPEELRAVGQAYAEESPVRAILERNVLNLDAPVFAPLDQISAMDVAPAPAASAPSGQSGQPAQAAFAPLEANLSSTTATNSSTTLGAPAVPAVSEALSGGHTVVGRIAPPVAASAPVTASAPGGASSPPAQATTATPQQTTTTPHPLSAPAAGATPAQTAHAPAPRHAPAAPVSAAPAPAPAPSLAGMRLVGVIAGGEKPLAMLNVDGQALSLKVGDTVRGWTLSAVEPGQVVLKSGEHVRRLGLGGTAPTGAGHGQRVVAP
jgi:hypothetical protein